MTKEELEDYLSIGLKVKALDRRIQNLEEMAARYEYGAVKGSNPNFPYQQKSFHVSGYSILDDEKKRMRIYQLKEQLVKMKKKEEDKRLEVEEFINSIEDTTTQLIFTYYYLEGLTQEAIGKKLCMDHSRVSRRISDYLKKTHTTHKTNVLY